MVIKQTKVYWLVVVLTILKKYEFVNGKDDIPYMKWKIKMFQTTNQYTKVSNQGWPTKDTSNPTTGWLLGYHALHIGYFWWKWQGIWIV